MPFFLIETCLTLRFTFSEVNTKIGPNSVPELSINLIEALSTDKLRLIVSSWISLLTGLGLILEKLVNPQTQKLTLHTPETTDVKSVFFPFTNLLVGSIFR